MAKINKAFHFQEVVKLKEGQIDIMYRNCVYIYREVTEITEEH